MKVAAKIKRSAPAWSGLHEEWAGKGLGAIAPMSGWLSAQGSCSGL
jgi:hypothetical protein